MTLVSVRGPVLLGLAALLALPAGFGVWAKKTTLAGAIMAQDQIAGESDPQVVQHPEGCVVTAILVKDGDNVSAGDVLVRLDDRALRSDLRIADDRLFDPLARAATSAEVAAQIDGQTRLFPAQRADTNLRFCF